jgi:P27 family predicted phage terminase small subunit
MGGKGSGGHNKRSLQDHLRLGTYRPVRHGPLPDKMAARVHGKRHGRHSVNIKPVTADTAVEGKTSAPAKAPKNRLPAKAPAKQHPKDGALQIPAWFDDNAAAAFKRVCQILVDRGTLQDVNHATLEGYCEAYSKAVRADKVINEKGFTVGTMPPKKRPEVDISFKAWSQVKMFAVELGITQSVGNLTPPKDESAAMKETIAEVDQFLKQHRTE